MTPRECLFACLALWRVPPLLVHGTVCLISPDPLLQGLGLFFLAGAWVQVKETLR